MIVTENTTSDAIDRNQNIEDQLQRMSKSPLINGATLGGVFKLVLKSAQKSVVGFGQAHDYKIDMNPV